MHHEDHAMFVGQAFGGIVMLAVCIDDTILLVLMWWLVLRPQRSTSISVGTKDMDCLYILGNWNWS